MFCGGYSTPAVTNVIEYVEIATTGNAIDFGDMLTARSYVACASNGTRGVLTGEGTPGAGSNVIEYLAIATLGNTQDFGDLTVSRQGFDGTSNNIRGVFGGGSNPARQNVIDYMYWQVEKNGMSATSVAKHLNKEGLKGKRGGNWSSTSVLKVLRNPFHERRRKFPRKLKKK